MKYSKFFLCCDFGVLLIVTFIYDVSGDSFNISVGEAVVCKHLHGSLNFIVNLTSVAAVGEGSSDESCYGWFFISLRAFTITVEAVSQI